MMRWALFACCALILPAGASGQISTQGDCSPVVTETQGDVTITCNLGPDPADDFSVEYVRAQLSCNSDEESRMEKSDSPSDSIILRSAPELFRRLRGLDGNFVFVDISVWVGYGCGLDDLADWGTPKWGVVYDIGTHLDGFPGDHDRYLVNPAESFTEGYGYRMDLDKIYPDYSAGWASVLPFPQSDEAFFQAKFGSAMRFYGLVRIRVTDVQGTEVVEMIPTIPVGGLATHFARVERFIEETFASP